MKRRWVQGMLLAGMLVLTGCGAKNSSPVENGKDYTWNDITVMLPEDLSLIHISEPTRH